MCINFNIMEEQTMLDKRNVNKLNNDLVTGRILVNISNPFWEDKNIDMKYCVGSISNILIGFSYKNKEYQLAIIYDIHDVTSITMNCLKKGKNKSKVKIMYLDNHIGVYKQLFELDILSFSN